MWKSYINPNVDPLPLLTTTSVSTESECAHSNTNIGWDTIIHSMELSRAVQQSSTSGAIRRIRPNKVPQCAGLYVLWVGRVRTMMGL